MKFEIISFLATGGGGLNGLWENVRDNWMGPIFFAAVAFYAFTFLKDRAWMKLVTFLGIAAIVGVLLFAGDSILGKDSGLQKNVKDLAEDINVVDATYPITNLNILP